ncbi:LEA type 2 family protein [Amycolatopsis sp. NPDC059657]|uniref:NDR1/HIN1-like protein n=1 Tax=Amycolatopsis sp. NPDC059657 TaxID=3346899 RepID=UPI003671F72A
MRKFSKKTAIALAAAGALTMAGVAYAAWSSSGAGSGSVTSTTALNSTISPTGTSDALYPGAAKTFTITVNNPNSYPVKVTSISTGSSAADGGCGAGSVTSDAVSNPSGTIGANGSATYTLTAHMTTDADDACQGKTFSLNLTATLASAA